MADARAVGSTVYTYKEVANAFKARGWTFVAEGVKVAQFNRDGIKMGVRRNDKIHDLTPVLVEAAKLDNMSVADWMRPPEPVESNDQPSAEDIEFFVSNKQHLLKWDEDVRRYRSIRNALEKAGTLNHWLEVRNRRAETPIPPAASAPTEPMTPLPLSSDGEGYTSLDDALALVDRKRNVLGLTACKIIAALAEGEVRNSSGQAAAMLRDRMKDPPGPAGISGLLREFEEKGLVWRDTNGKRTYGIGLCMPVKLLQADRVAYLADARPVVTIEPEPVALVAPEPPPTPVEAPADVAPPVEAEPVAPPPPEPGPEPGSPPASTAPAIELLRAELVRLMDEMVERSERIGSLVHAIQVLEGLR